MRLASRKRRHHGKRHAVLHGHLAGQAGSDLGIVFGPVVGRAGTAESAEAAGPADDFLPAYHMALMTVIPSGTSYFLPAISIVTIRGFITSGWSITLVSSVAIAFSFQPPPGLRGEC